MKNRIRECILVAVVLGLSLSSTGCRRALNLAVNNVELEEGKETMVSIAVSAGKADKVEPSSGAVDGLSASIDGTTIKVISSGDVKAGSYTFTVTGRRSKAEFIVNVVKREVVASSENITAPVVPPIVPLVLESTRVQAVAGNEPAKIAVKSGKIKRAISANEQLQVSMSPEENLIIFAPRTAAPGDYEVAVAGTDDRQTIVNVRVRAPNPLEAESSRLQFTAGREETRLVKLRSGWALQTLAYKLNGLNTTPENSVAGLSVTIDDKLVNAFVFSGGENYGERDDLTVESSAASPVELRVDAVDQKVRSNNSALVTPAVILLQQPSLV